MDSDINFELKKLLKWSRGAVFFLAIFLAGQALITFKAVDNTNPAYNSIQVTGKGEAVTIPDIATFSFTISTDAKNVGDAQATVTKKMDAILSDLKAMGIEDKDIKTTDYSVWPKYSYVQSICTNGMCPPSRQVADGYTVNHSILVKVRETADAGKALASVGDKGATNISGLTFTNDDPDKVLKEARAEAIKDAKNKAENLAKSLGVRLVKVVGYYDNNQNGYPMMADNAGYAGISMMKSVASAPTVPTGENKVTANVTVTYEIR